MKRNWMLLALLVGLGYALTGCSKGDQGNEPLKEGDYTSQPGPPAGADAKK